MNDVKRTGYDVKRFTEWLAKSQDFITGEISLRYAEFVKKHYLSGQVLRAISGKTRSSVKFAKLKKGRFLVRPGFGIPGMLNYLVKFERGNKPFMLPSAKKFKQKRLHLQTMREYIQEVIG